MDAFGRFRWQKAGGGRACRLAPRIIYCMSNVWNANNVHFYSRRLCTFLRFQFALLQAWAPDPQTGAKPEQCPCVAAGVATRAATYDKTDAHAYIVGPKIRPRYGPRQPHVQYYDPLLRILKSGEGMLVHVRRARKRHCCLAGVFFSSYFPLLLGQWYRTSG